MTRYSVLGLAVAGLLIGSQAAPAADEAAIARGKYLVEVGGCTDCHTPWVMGEKGPEPDNSRYLSGHPAEMVLPPAPELPEGPWVFTGAGSMTAWAGPWGVSFTQNLTSDEETGVGGWEESEFIGAMKTGRHRGMGRPILPPMPFWNLAAMTDEDLSAVFAFLQSLPPIHNKVPDPIPPAGGEHADH